MAMAMASEEEAALLVDLSTPDGSPKKMKSQQGERNAGENANGLNVEGEEEE